MRQFLFTVLSICAALVTYFYLCSHFAPSSTSTSLFHLQFQFHFQSPCKFLHNPRAKFLTEINSFLSLFFFLVLHFYFAFDKLGPDYDVLPQTNSARLPAPVPPSPLSTLSTLSLWHSSCILGLLSYIASHLDSGACLCVCVSVCVSVL